MLTPARLLRCVSALIFLALVPACAPKPETIAAIETKTALVLCNVWQESLPTRSRKDTEQTQKEIGEGYDDFLVACDPLPLPF